MSYVALPTSTTDPGASDLGVVVRVAGMPNVHALDQEFITEFHAEIEGRHAMIWHIMGSRTKGWSSTSVLGDACEYLDTSQPRANDVSAASTYYIRSSSASDDGAPVGTGARTVRIYYLDTTGVAATVTVTMDGTTATILPEGTAGAGAGKGYSYFLWAEVATVGSNTESVGDIAISTTAAGAPAVSTIVEWIESGGNRSLSGRCKVPLAHTGYLIDWQASAISATMDVRVRADSFADDGALSSGVFHFKDRAFLASGANADRTLHYKKVPALCEVKISAFPGGAPAGNKIDCDFDILLIADA